MPVENAIFAGPPALRAMEIWWWGSMLGRRTDRAGICGSTAHGQMDGPSRRETLVIALAIAVFVVGHVFFQALFLAFPLTCGKWAWAFLISGSLLACILVAIIVLLIHWPTR